MISDASPMHMARDLVARHSDIGFIRGYIINYFGRAPSRDKIEQLRAEYVAKVDRERNRLEHVIEQERAKKRRHDQRRSESRRAKRITVDPEAIRAQVLSMELERARRLVEQLEREAREMGRGQAA